MNGVPDPAQYTTPDALLAALNAYVDAADVLLESGNMVELSGLDAVVDVLCARVLALSVEDGRNHAEALDAFHGRLGELQQRMTELRDVIRKEMAEQDKRSKATRAYRKEPE